MKAINKDTIREIKKSKMRFFYICAIIALGVAFFCGIKAVSPSMIETAVDYFDQYRLSDFRLLSTYGFRTEDIERLGAVDGVESAEGAYSMDVIMQIGDEKNVIKIMSLSSQLDMNVPLLIEGRLPVSTDECVIEEPSRHLQNYQIGDQIEVLSESHTPDELKNLKSRQFVITGFVQTPQYISIERGNTTISDGSIDGYVMVLPESFDYARYTEAYIFTDVSQNSVSPYSDVYSSAQETMIHELENVGQEILDDNLKSIKKTANSKIDDAENELEDKQREFFETTNAAHLEIENQAKKLRDGYNEYLLGVRTFNTEIQNAQNQLSAGESELQQGIDAYYSGVETMNRELASAEEQLQTGKDKYLEGVEQYKAGKQLLTTQLALGESQLKQGWDQFNLGYEEYNSGLNRFNNSIALAQKKLEEGEKSIEEGMKEYQEALSKLNNQFGSAQDELDAGFSAYENALAEYNASLEEFNNQINAAQEQIDNSKNELSQAEEGYEKGYADYLAGRDAYNQALAEFEAQKPEAQAQIENLQGQQQNLKGSLDALESKVNEAASQVAAAEQAVAQVNSQLQSVVNSISSADSQIEAANSRLQAIDKELATNPNSQALLAEKASLTSQISSLQEQKNGLIAQQSQLEAQLQEQTAKLEELKGPKEELDKQYADLKSQYDGLGAEISKIQTELEATEASLAERGRELDQTEQTLSETKATIDNSKADIEASEAELQAQKEAGEQKFEASSEELEASYTKLIAAQTELDSKKEAAYDQLQTSSQPLFEAQEELKRGRAELEEQQKKGRAELDQALADLTVARSQLEYGEAQLREQGARGENELASAAAELSTAKETLDAGFRTLEVQRNLGLNQLSSAWSTLEAASIQLRDGRLQLIRERDNGLAQLEAALNTILNGENQLEEGQRELEKQESEGETQLNDGWKKIEISRQDVQNISRGEWFVNTRDDNPGYSGYQQDAERIDNVGNVFPLFFFLVAALVAFTTMTRMVEEERTQIGTLYALGYSRSQILRKYITYAGLAALIGATIGWIFGVLVFPILIFWAYNILYQMPDMILSIPWHIVVISYIVSFACTIGAAVIVALSELRSVPAELMRPKAPKPGKRIFLEHIPFIWNRLGFITKVSMRNIFRYKARFFMTVVGIAGCMALILAGFGLHDAIFTIVPSQYGVINHYDQSLIVKDTEKSIDQKAAEVIADTRVSDAMPVDQQTIDVIADSENPSAYLIVPEDPGNFSSFVSLHERTKRDQPIALTDEGVVVSEKLATNYGAQPGEEIEIEIENRRYSVKVAAQTENYLENYVYMTPTLFEQVVKKAPKYSLIYVNFTDDLTDTKDQEQFSADMIATGDYTSAVNVATAVDTANKTLQSLNVLVIVMIVSAGMLAFIVLNNLTNINISERIREIATLKVLGFRSKETNNYIFRENIVLSVFGILLGIVLGILLLRFIITTVELDIIMFGREIHPLSYLYSIVLTLGFTIIVNFTMIPIINRVDMVEALKDID